MKIAQKYSHLNGEEYLMVHHKDVYNELKKVIKDINGADFKTKQSEEKTMLGTYLYNPIEINKEFKRLLKQLNWVDTRYDYYVTTDRVIMQELLGKNLKEQKETLIAKGISQPIHSYKQTDFVKDEIAVEVQFGKYAFVAYDLFVKHLLFYSGGIINIGIEILPTKKMQNEMSTGIAYFEGEVYNVLRHGRNNPPVPLLILGVEP